MIVVLAGIACFCSAAQAIAQERPFHTVLVIETDRPELPAYVEINDAFRTTLRDASRQPVEIFIESLDFGRFQREGYSGEMEDWLAKKYRDRQLDVVVAIGPIAYRAVAEWRERLWPDVPVVFGGLDHLTFETAGRLPDATGVRVEFGHLETIRVALEILPATQYLVIVGGVPKRDRLAGVLSVQLVGEFGETLEIIDLTGLPMDDILERTRRLPDDSIIIVTSVTTDGAGRAFSSVEACALLAAEANAPAFGSLSTYHGTGIVGGVLLELNAVGRVTAELVGRVLAGEAAGSIPVMDSDSNQPAFDWRQLERWRIPRRRLPPGSSVDFRPPTIWQEHWRSIVTAVAIFVLQATLIVALLRSRRRRREINRDLHRLSGRLITAQEDERRRVARELHDDISQRLALLAIEIETDAAEGSPGSDGLAEKLPSKVHRLARDVHSIAHGLHPSRLDSMGLPASLKAFCEEIERRHDVRIVCEVGEELAPLEPDHALTVYRVAQEAVQNALRHGGVDEITVELAITPRWVSLVVSDKGSGFSEDENSNDYGLGIAGMRERLSLVGGWLSLESEPGEGTTVSAWVPLQSEKNAEVADDTAASPDC